MLGRPPSDIHEPFRDAAGEQPHRGDQRDESVQDVPVCNNFIDSFCQRPTRCRQVASRLFELSFIR